MGASTVFDEQSDVSAAATSSDFFIRLCHDWEAATALAANSRTRKVIVRIGVVLGRTGGIVANVIQPFSLGLASTLANDGR